MLETLVKHPIDCLGTIYPLVPSGFQFVLPQWWGIDPLTLTDVPCLTVRPHLNDLYKASTSNLN